MRVEDIYGEDSPEPTKRDDTPRQEKKKEPPKNQEKEEAPSVWPGLFKFIVCVLFSSLLAGFVRGLGCSDIPKKVY